jgi:hypothetical protein
LDIEGGREMEREWLTLVKSFFTEQQEVVLNSLAYFDFFEPVKSQIIGVYCNMAKFGCFAVDLNS